MSCKKGGIKSDCRCCKGCSFKLPANSKLFHQGLVGSGCGKPPQSCDFNPTLQCNGGSDQCVEDELCPPFDFGSIECDEDNVITVAPTPIAPDDLCQPVEKDGSLPFTDGDGINFLYENWVDTCSNVLYVLRRDSKGRPKGYQRVPPEGLNFSKFELDLELDSRFGRDIYTNSGDVNNDTSFVFSFNPPVPSIVSGWNNLGIGATTTPDTVLTGSYAGYQVFIRDKRNNMYYRDSFNSNCTYPNYPCDPCDGDCFEHELSNGVLIEYQFNADFCQWYLAECMETFVAGELDVPLCELACCWNRCGKRVGPNPDCENPFNASKKKCGCCKPGKGKSQALKKCCGSGKRRK